MNRKKIRLLSYKNSKNTSVCTAKFLIASLVDHRNRTKLKQKLTEIKERIQQGLKKEHKSTIKLSNKTQVLTAAFLKSFENYNWLFRQLLDKSLMNMSLVRSIERLSKPKAFNDTPLRSKHKQENLRYPALKPRSVSSFRTNKNMNCKNSQILKY